MMQKQAIRLQTETHMLLRMGELFQSLNKGLETRTIFNYYDLYIYKETIIIYPIKNLSCCDILCTLTIKFR